MKPAISVILLTTLIGAGQGLFLAYYSAEVFSLLTLLPASSNDQSITAAGPRLKLYGFVGPVVRSNGFGAAPRRLADRTHASTNFRVRISGGSHNE